MSIESEVLEQFIERLKEQGIPDRMIAALGERLVEDRLPNVELLVELFIAAPEETVA